MRFFYFQYRMDGSAYEASLTIIPVFDWLGDPAWAEQTEAGNDSSGGESPGDSQITAAVVARAGELLRSRQALDYGGDFDECTVQQKDRIVMNPSHFVAHLAVDVPPPPPRARQGENDLDFHPNSSSSGEEMHGSSNIPPLSAKQIRARDNSSKVKF